MIPLVDPVMCDIPLGRKDVQKTVELNCFNLFLLLLVLVCLGCYNKIPWVVLLVRETVLEAEIKALADSVSGEDPLPHRHISL